MCHWNSLGQLYRPQKILRDLHQDHILNEVEPKEIKEISGFFWESINKVRIYNYVRLPHTEDVLMHWIQGKQLELRSKHLQQFYQRMGTTGCH